MKKILLGFCLVLFSIITLKAQSLEYLVNDPETFLVDVRTPTEFNAGNVDSSVNIPLNVLDKNLDKFRDKDKIVVFCEKGIRSAKAVKLLKENGIKVVDGGTWQNVQSLQKNKK